MSTQNTKIRPNMARTLSAALALYLFWLVLSGFFTAFLLSAGFACAVAVALFGRRMEVVDREGHPVHLTWRALAYWPWLVKEIVKSAWSVSRIILDPKLPISPTLVRFKPTQRTPEGLVTHANSITLTPGTISIEVGADEFLVHAVTREGAAGVESGDMDRRVTRFEGDD
ncbi:MAG: Na+/H+ antiporter subunit E [Rhodocyclaceae bacterium]